MREFVSNKNLTDVLGDLIRTQKDSYEWYILDSDLGSLNLDESEMVEVTNFLEENGISVRKRDELLKENAKLLVRDFEYGSMEDNTSLKKSVKVANVCYDDNGNVIFSDFKEIADFLEKEFIPKHIQNKKRYNNMTGEVSYYQSIQLNKIVRLGLSEIEFAYVMDYLSDSNIMVSGRNTSLESEFSNYQSLTTYRGFTYPLKLENDELYFLLAQYRENPTIEIRNKIVEGNMRLVPYICSKYINIINIPFSDICSCGFEFLIKAVEKFDLSYGTTFSTYACSAIERGVAREIAELAGFCNTTEFFDYINVRNAILDYYQENGESFPDNINEEIIMLLRETGEYSDKKLQKMEFMINNLNYVEFDKIKNDLVDDVTLDKTIIVNFFNKEIRNSIDSLPKREADFIKLYYGIDCDSCSLTKISEIYNLSCSRVGQIVRKACCHLRHPSSRFKDFMDYYSEIEKFPSTLFEESGKMLIK